MMTLPMTDRQRVEVRVQCFPGYYCSIIDDCDGNILNDENEYRREYNLSPAVNYHFDYDAIGKHFIDYIVKDCAGIDSAEYSGTECPREYNFRSDYLFCTVDFDEINKIYRDLRKNHREVLDRVLKCNFKSKDGFISFIDYKLEDEDWDGTDKHCWNAHQWGAILTAHLIVHYCEGDESRYHDLACEWWEYGNGYEAIANATEFEYEEPFDKADLHTIRQHAREIFNEWCADTPPHDRKPVRFKVDWDELYETRLNSFYERNRFDSVDDWLEDINLEAYMTPVYWHDRHTLPLPFVV